MVSTLAQRAAQSKRYRERRKSSGWQDKRGNRHPKSTSWPFIGCDGEGGEINGRHQYLMLRIGDQTLMHDDRSKIGTAEILNFLCDLPREERIYVGYFFDYDVTHILMDLDPYKLKRLMQRNMRKRIYDNRTDYFPVDWTDPWSNTTYELDYMPRKEFKVRRKGEKRYFVINDVGSFFQCAFRKALEDWKIGTPEQLEAISEGKSGRINFGELTDETIRYNAIEIDLLEQLMEEFRRATQAANMLPSKWQGPGQIASSIFKQHNMIKGYDVKERLPEELLKAANDAYYGGRFEITAIGPIAGPVFQHDINSAYPYAETLLPCLEHGRWFYRDTDHLPSRGLYLAFGSFTANQEVNLYGLPHRTKKGNICWPSQAGEGWYWSHEIKAAIYQDFKPKKIWEYVPNCTCQPFNYVPALYRERAKLGKEAKGIAIKLGLNSTYGKTCQSVGEPQYANPIYASLITSITRAQLYSKCVKLGVSTVVMLATDGIFTTSEVDKNHSPKIEYDGYTLKPLGDWEVTTYNDGIFIVQPGLYFLPDGKKPKTRGVPMNKVREHEQDFRDQYNKLADLLWKAPGLQVLWGLGDPFKSHAVHIPLRSLMNIKLAVHTNRKRDMGQWVPTVKRISFDWRSKRFGATFNADGSISVGTLNMGDTPTTPYSKDIGAMFMKMAMDQLLDYDPDSPELLAAVGAL